MPAPMLHTDLWPTVCYLVHTIATRGSCNGSNISKYPPKAGLSYCCLLTSGIDTKLFYVSIYACAYTSYYRDLWPTVGHLVHTIATRGGLMVIILLTTLKPQCHLSTRDAIYIWPGRQVITIDVGRHLD